MYAVITYDLRLFLKQHRSPAAITAESSFVPSPAEVAAYLGDYNGRTPVEPEVSAELQPIHVRRRAHKRSLPAHLIEEVRNDLRPIPVIAEAYNVSDRMIRDIRTGRAPIRTRREPKGVTLKGNTYSVQITLDGKRQCLGTFATAEEAAAAYEAARLGLPSTKQPRGRRLKLNTAY